MKELNKETLNFLKVTNKLNIYINQIERILEKKEKIGIKNLLKSVKPTFDKVNDLIFELVIEKHDKLLLSNYPELIGKYQEKRDRIQYIIENLTVINNIFDKEEHTEKNMDVMNNTMVDENKCENIKYFINSLISEGLTPVICYGSFFYMIKTKCEFETMVHCTHTLYLRKIQDINFENGCILVKSLMGNKELNHAILIDSIESIGCVETNYMFDYQKIGHYFSDMDRIFNVIKDDHNFQILKKLISDKKIQKIKIEKTEFNEFIKKVMNDPRCIEKEFKKAWFTLSSHVYALDIDDPIGYSKESLFLLFGEEINAFKFWKKKQNKFDRELNIKQEEIRKEREVKMEALRKERDKLPYNERKAIQDNIYAEIESSSEKISALIKREYSNKKDDIDYFEYLKIIDMYDSVEKINDVIISLKKSA